MKRGGWAKVSDRWRLFGSVVFCDEASLDPRTTVCTWKVHQVCVFYLCFTHTTWFYLGGYKLQFAPSWIPTHAASWPLFNNLSLWFPFEEKVLIRPRRIPLVLFPLPSSVFIMQLRPRRSHCDIPWPWCSCSCLLPSLKTCFFILHCCLYLFVFFSSLPRMIPGLSCTPLLCSRLWATCCASAMADRPRRVSQISGSLCWVWLWELLAMLFSLAMQPHLSSRWTPPDGSIRKRWEAGCFSFYYSSFKAFFTF